MASNMSQNARNATKIYKMVKKRKYSGILFHELIMIVAQLNDSTLLTFDNDETDEEYEEHIESVFNNYNQDIQDGIHKNNTYSTENLKHFTSVIREATDNFGCDILEGKDITQQLELYIYLEAKTLLVDMRTEFIATDLKEKQKKEDTQNSLATISLLRGELRDLKNLWKPTGFKHLDLVTQTLEKERARVKELLKY